MRIVFIGTVKFSKSALIKLVEMNENVIAVFTKQQSKFNSDYAELKPICEENDIPCYFVDNINEEQNVNLLSSLNPDVIFCFGFSQLIRKDILTIPKKGVIGFHPADLPRNRGRHPIIWALFLGLNETASTFFIMDEGPDTGDIISKVRVPIFYEDDAASLYERITATALTQIEQLTKDLKIGKLVRVKQDESLSNYWRKRTIFDGKIDFRMSSYAIYNLVRALTRPYIGAHLVYRGKEIKIWCVKEEIINMPNIEPGKILEVNGNTLLVKAYDNAIRIIDHDFTDLPSVGEYL